MNNKGHFTFSTKETFVICSIGLTVIYSVLTLISIILAYALKFFCLRAVPTWKIVITILIIVTVAAIAYQYIKQWHWQHYGFYYSYRDDIVRVPDLWKQYAIDTNTNEIYKNDKPFIVQDKYYGWKMIHEDDTK
ncbi:MAG: hypothetical protein PHX51_08300 [Clostridia bacterium]|nr:hypothetical protein [Clostridia bacterium]